MKTSAVLLVAIGCLFGRVAFGSTEFIINGGFETLPPAPWSAALGITNVPVVTNPLQAHDGNNFLELGNPNFNEAVLQSVDLPTNTLLARFSYFWGGAIGNDPVGAEIMSSFIEPANQTPIYLNPHGSANANYQLESFDFTSYAGQRVLLGFVVQTNMPGVGFQTFFAMDDISLIIFTSDDIPANDNFANATLLTTTTNVSVTVTNVVATKEPGEPKHAGAQGGHSVWWKWVAPANGTVTINTTNSTFNTVLAVYTGTTVSNLTQVAANDDANGQTTSQVKANVTAGTEYEIAVDGKGSASGVVQLNLRFTSDTQVPTVAITSPKSGAKLTNSTVTVQGTASDNLGVALVQYRLENAAGTNDYQNATGTNNWTATINNLIPGPNTIRVVSFDTSGNESSEKTVTVNYVVVSLLTVQINGTGTVTPNLGGTLQPVGNTLTLTAKAGTGQVFSNWTGGAESTSPALTFVMQSNMTLVANFVPNPFIPVAGTYEGLIYQNVLAPQSSGFINAKLSTGGAFTAKIVLGGQNLSLSGQFSAGGSFSNSIARKGSTPLSAQLNLDLASGTLTGQIGDGSGFTQILAYRAATSAGATAGKYTLLIPGNTNGVGTPGGDSYATIVVSSTGAISLTGVLADGTKVAQKANLLTNGVWPFYVNLYSGRGSILSWLTFNDGVIDGPAYWFKLSGAGGLYPAGFTNATQAAGSSYRFTNGVPVLNFADGQLWLANGNLANSVTNGIALDSASKVTSTNATLKVTLTTSTGAFKGTLPNPAGGKAISFSGVVLQNQNFGGGFFTGTNQAGRVFIGP